MATYRRLLVPRDYSPTSEQALELGVAMAARTGADLHLLHAEVLHSDPVSERQAAEQAMSEDAVRDRLAALVATRGGGSPGRVVTVTIRDVAAAPAIVRYAEEEGIDLIVMGTHGRRGVRRLFLGSVMEEVVRAADRDVLVVRGDAAEIASRAVVVGADFSQSSRHAIGKAARLADWLGGRLHVVHVAHMAPYPAFYGTEVAAARDLPEHFLGDAEAALIEFAGDVLGGAEKAQFAVEVGQPFRRLAAYANSVGAGLIVVGTRGLSGLPHVLLGSTSERLLREASVPVLVTKLPPGETAGAAYEVDS